ncbi:MAG: 4-alpha-glucanotransferase, partial [Actinobacteria bacterium]
MQPFRPDERAGGVILHPTSLPGPFGIGDLGPEAHRWVDRLADTETGLWQVLPLGPTGYADSPYACFSSFAGNTNLISPEWLRDHDLIAALDHPGFADRVVPFGDVIPWKRALVGMAHEAFLAGRGDSELAPAFDRFRAENDGWLDDFTLFMALKEAHGGAAWTHWDEALRKRRPEAMQAARRAEAEAIEVAAFAQFLFFTQWSELRRHAAERSVRIIGDVPIFAAGDSADVWSRQELFALSDDGTPSLVAGVPPDFFTDTGQLWGNPQYRWERHAEEGYAWWASRLGAAFSLTDIVRIDHFRAFADYWEIPAGSATAVHGTWRDGPGIEFFDAMRRRLGQLPIIAEDLGELSPKVPELLEATGFPGMRILQFAWYTDDHNPFLPHNYVHNTVAYTGTHDNDTTLGWWRTAPRRERRRAAKYIRIDRADPVAGFLETLWESVAMYAIVPLQDLLRLGPEGRMNEPGTTSGNWTWRADGAQMASGFGEQLA